MSKSAIPPFGFTSFKKAINEKEKKRMLKASKQDETNLVSLVVEKVCLGDDEPPLGPVGSLLASSFLVQKAFLLDVVRVKHRGHSPCSLSSHVRHVSSSFVCYFSSISTLLIFFFFFFVCATSIVLLCSNKQKLTIKQQMPTLTLQQKEQMPKKKKKKKSTNANDVSLQKKRKERKLFFNTLPPHLSNIYRTDYPFVKPPHSSCSSFVR